MLTKDIKKIITDSLNTDKDDNVIEEAYVANQKQFKLNTEYLSDSNKQNHIELYKGYIENFLNNR